MFEFGLELLENLDWVETFEVQLVLATEYIGKHFLYLIPKWIHVKEA